MSKNLSEQTYTDAEEARRKDEIYEAAKKRLPGDKVVKLNSFPYEKALQELESIRDWKDSEALIEQTAKTIEELREQEARIEEDRQAYLAKRKKRKRALVLIPLAILALAALVYFVLWPEGKYLRAMNLSKNGHYVEAYRLLTELKSEKSQKALQEIIPKYKKQLMDEAAVGTYIILGSFEQDNRTQNGKELLEWQILAKEDGKMLLITRFGIDAQPYNYKDFKSNWEGSTLRAWLNSDFYEESFSETDKALIAETQVKAEINPEFGTSSGADTVDKVFILSISEAERWFADAKDRCCQPTAYARAWGAYQADNDGCWYWLRTAGASREAATAVIATGSISTRGERVMSYRITVRPAVWISLNE